MPEFLPSESDDFVMPDDAAYREKSLLMANMIREMQPKAPKFL